MKKTARRRRRNPSPDYAIAHVILNASARAVYATSWADRVEEMGVSLHGEIMDQAPPTSQEARQWAEELWTSIVDQNPMSLPAGASLPASIEEIWAEAARRADVDFDDESEANDFGHYVAMEAMGHGVAWSDSHEDHELEIPHDEADAWSIVPTVDLVDSVDNANLEEALEDVYGENDPDDDDEEDEDARRAWLNFDRWEQHEDVVALSHLVDQLNHAEAYENEDARRAHAIAYVLLAGAQRGRLPPEEPRENPVSKDIGSPLVDVSTLSDGEVAGLLKRAVKHKQALASTGMPTDGVDAEIVELRDEAVRRGLIKKNPASHELASIFSKYGISKDEEKKFEILLRGNKRKGLTQSEAEKAALESIKRIRKIYEDLYQKTGHRMGTRRNPASQAQQLFDKVMLAGQENVDEHGIDAVLDETENIQLTEYLNALFDACDRGEFPLTWPAPVDDPLAEPEPIKLDAFNGVEIQPVGYIDPDDPSAGVEVVDDEDADFWTTYWHLEEGGVQAVKDFVNLEQATLFAGALELMLDHIDRLKYREHMHEVDRMRGAARRPRRKGDRVRDT